MQAPAAARHADSPPLDASGQAQEAGHPSSRWIALFTHPGTVFKRSTPFWLDFSGISLCKRQEARLPCCPNVRWVPPASFNDSATRRCVPASQGPMSVEVPQKSLATCLNPAACTPALHAAIHGPCLDPLAPAAAPRRWRQQRRRQQPSSCARSLLVQAIDTSHAPDTRAERQQQA